MFFYRETLLRSEFLGNWDLALNSGRIKENKLKATSVWLSNPSYGLLESGKVGRQKKENLQILIFVSKTSSGASGNPNPVPLFI
jgi:hypothetical protein